MCDRARRRSAMRVAMLHVPRGSSLGLRITLLVCVSLLIVLSNDVESNPGPLPGPARNTRQSTLDASLEPSLRDVISEIQGMRSEISTNFEKLNARITSIETDIQTLSNENLDLRKQLANMTSKVDSLDGQNRRNNIIVYNVEDTPKEAAEETERKLTEVFADKMGIEEEINLDRVSRIPTKSTGPRPIIATFRTPKQKTAVMSRVKNLKTHDIRISHDYTDAVRSMRQGLKPFMEEARGNDLFSILKHDKLQIDNKLYKLDNTDANNHKLICVRTFKPRNPKPDGSQEQ